MKDRLRMLLPDVRDNVALPIRKWILKACDVSKDVEIDSVAQITLPDIQIPFFDKTLRAYVKPIGDDIYYRVELSIEPDKKIGQALDCLRREIKIGTNCFSLNG